MNCGQLFLVVEDDPDVLHLMERAIRAPDRTVATSGNAGDALAEFEAANGDVTLVISDVVLPDISGPTMVQRMLVERPDFKVLFTTGHSDDTVANYLGDMHCALLRKPFTVAQLRSAIAADSQSEAPDERSGRRVGLG